MSISQRRGVISLLPKEDANLLKLANWRPITLLNVDYKIASKGITVFQKELKISQFADDTTLLCNHCNSVNWAITVLNSFGILSGLRLNPSNTKALWLGSLRNRRDEPFNFKAKSLKLAWISRFLQSVPAHDDESRKVIPNHFFDKYGGLNFLLRCNYDKNFLDKMCLPYFYKLILLHFLELKISYNTQFCRFVLFNNKDILIGGRSFFHRSWMNKYVFLVQDLLGDGKVLS